MLAQIVHEAFGLLCREFEIVDADELRPAETEGAIGVAGLAVAWEEQHRLFVLVLYAVEALLVQHRHVVLELAGGVGVEGQTNPVRGLVDNLTGSAALDERGHLLEVPGREHAPLRESQREYRIVGDVIPVDQLVHDIIVGLKRKNAGDDIDRQPLVVLEELGLRNVGDVVARNRAVFDPVITRWRGREDGGGGQGLASFTRAAFGDKHRPRSNSPPSARGRRGWRRGGRDLVSPGSSERLRG